MAFIENISLKNNANVSINPATADNQIIAGSVGNVSAQVVTIQGITGMTPVNISGNINNFPSNQITTDINLANCVVIPGNTVISSMVLVGGKTNDTTPQYQEIPLSSNGTSVITSVIDNTILANISNISVGAGSSINTNGFPQISLQFNGSFTGDIHIEISNDNINWFRSQFQEATTNVILDALTNSGIISVQANSKYIRYFVDTITGSCSVIAIGKLADNDISLPEMACDLTSGVTMNTTLAGGISVDQNKSIILSDAPKILQLEGAVNTSIIFDTQGYDSFNITAQSMAASVYSSNDQITWSALTGVPLVLGAVVTTIAANTGYSFPCIARYIKLVVTTAGSATAFLRDVPWYGNYTTTGPTAGPTSTLTTTTNLNQINGTTPVTAGVAGTLGVGGNLPAGSTPTTNPLLIGGVDSTNLLRKLGILNTTAFQNTPSLAVTELSQFEGQTFIELLGQILVELKINNYYQYNLSFLLNNGITPQVSEEPNNLRNEPIITF